MPTQEELILKQFAGARQKLGQQKKTAAQELERGLGRQAVIGGLKGGAAIKARAKALKGLEEGFSTAQSELEGAEAGELRAATADKEAKQFAREERLGSQDFAAAESQRGREFTTGEREAIQAFQQAERLGAQDFASAEAQIGREFTTSERQAIQDYQSQEREKSQEFATQERLGGQEFQSRENLLSRDQADRQFKDTLNFQKNSFAEQLALQKKEFDENIKTNLINAAIALKEAGLVKQRPGESLADAARRTAKQSSSSLMSPTMKGSDAVKMAKKNLPKRIVGESDAAYKRRISRMR